MHTWTPTYVQEQIYIKRKRTIRDPEPKSSRPKFKKVSFYRHNEIVSVNWTFLKVKEWIFHPYFYVHHVLIISLVYFNLHSWIHFDGLFIFYSLGMLKLTKLQIQRLI